MSPLENILNAFKNSELFNKLGLGSIRLIKKRTREGIDLHGSPFKPYSVQYAKKRNREGKQTDVVQLIYDDYFGMVSRIDHVISRNLESVSVIIDSLKSEPDKPSKAEIAKFHNESGAGKSKVIREFFGHNPEEEKQLAELTNLEIKNIIQKL